MILIKIVTHFLFCVFREVARREQLECRYKLPRILFGSSFIRAFHHHLFVFSDIYLVFFIPFSVYLHSYKILVANDFSSYYNLNDLLLLIDAPNEKFVLVFFTMKIRINFTCMKL